MLTRSAIFLTVALWAAAPASQAQTAPDAYFQLGFDGVSDTFVIRLTDPARIQTARNILSGTETQLRHVSGIVVKALAFYNVPWTYHFDPNSISFFSFQRKCATHRRGTCSSISLRSAVLCFPGIAGAPGVPSWFAKFPARPLRTAR